MITILKNEVHLDIKLILSTSTNNMYQKRHGYISTSLLIFALVSERLKSTTSQLRPLLANNRFF